MTTRDLILHLANRIVRNTENSHNRQMAQAIRRRAKVGTSYSEDVELIKEIADEVLGVGRWFDK